jgi:hypothetical protein
MRSSLLFTVAAALLLAGSAQAAVKFYDASMENGTPGDTRVNTNNLCPPTQTTPGILEGRYMLTDDGLGTVTMEFSLEIDNLLDLSAESGQLISLFGPGAFIFSLSGATRTISPPAVSNTTGVGAHGPSSTSPGSSTEWGLISGWAITGFVFCLSSPTTICTDNVAPHGSTAGPVLNSATYDLGTWNFDSAGDMQAANWFINTTNNGGLTNSEQLIRGAFHGASLPALPLIGFGALACALLVIGGRALRGSR